MIKNSIKDFCFPIGLWGKYFKVCASEHALSVTEVNQSPVAQQIQMITFRDFYLHVCFTQLTHFHTLESRTPAASMEGLHT